MMSARQVAESSTAIAEVDATLANRHSTLASFADAYCECELSKLDRKMISFLALPDSDKFVLGEFPQRMDKLAKCVGANGKFLSLLEQYGVDVPKDISKWLSNNGSHEGTGGNEQTAGTKANGTSLRQPRNFSNGGRVGEWVGEKGNGEIDEVRRMFFALARDWSEFGKEYRSTCYSPIVQAVDDAYKEAARAVRSMEKSKFHVLVPYAGAGRLCWDLASSGFSVEGCESSLTLIVASNYFLNHSNTEEASEIFPFIHDSINVREGAAQAQAVRVPDVSPSTTKIHADFSMRTGNFTETYEDQEDHWDAVATCLAFSLTEEVASIVRMVSQILKPGGIWAFFGPALSASAENDELVSLHVSMSEFLEVLKKSGFRLVRHERRVCTTSQNPASLSSHSMEGTFFVAMKVRKVS